MSKKPRTQILKDMKINYASGKWYFLLQASYNLLWPLATWHNYNTLKQQTLGKKSTRI